MDISINYQTEIMCVAQKMGCPIVYGKKFCNDNSPLDSTVSHNVLHTATNLPMPNKMTHNRRNRLELYLPSVNHIESSLSHGGHGAETAHPLICEVPLDHHWSFYGSLSP